MDISLKKTISVALWDSKRECIISRTPEVKQINKFIDDTPLPVDEILPATIVGT